MKAVKESSTTLTFVESRQYQSKNYERRSILASHKQLAETRKTHHQEPDGDLPTGRSVYRSENQEVGNGKGREQKERKKEKKKLQEIF